MHVLLIEPHFAGHRPTYLYQYSKSLVELGHTVSIICGEDEKCRKYITVDNQLPGVNVFPFAETADSNKFISRLSIYNKYIFWKRLKLSLKGIEKIDFAFFMYFDYFLFNFNQLHFNKLFMKLKSGLFLNKLILPYFIDNCLPVKWSGLLFHSSHFNTASFEYIFRTKNNRSLAVLDETYDLAFEIKKRVVFPDITDEQDSPVLSELAEAVLKKAKGRKIISLLGSLEKRKGILPLLEVAQRMDPATYFFLIAGQPDVTYSEEEMRRIQLVKQLEHCYVSLEYIPTEYDFNSLVKITDILYVVYIGFFHSSNLLTKAGLFEKPVLSLQDHCIGKRVKKYNLGVTVTKPEVVEIENALTNFDQLFDGSKNKFKEYFSMHSRAQLKQSLKSILEN
jgi:hypothetical protein